MILADTTDTAAESSGMRPLARADFGYVCAAQQQRDKN
jgi:hypothetical protein